MIDMMTMNPAPAPKAKETAPAKEPAKSGQASKEKSSEFENLVKEYSKPEKAPQPKKVAPNKEIQAKEENETPSGEAQQMAVQWLVDMFSFTQQEAMAVVEEIINTGSSQQLLAVMSSGAEKQSQIAQLIDMLAIGQDTGVGNEELVANFASKFTQVVNENINLTQSNKFQAKTTVAGEEKQSIQQSPQVTVENQAKGVANELSAQADFKSVIKQAKAMLGETQQVKDNNTVDVDKLQEQTQSFKLAGGIRYVDSTVQTGMSEKELQSSVASQVKTGIVENLSQLKGVDKSEFVIKLRPEGLGEITVKMAQVGKEITLNIIAQKSETQRLISAELLQLKDALKPYNAQIEQVVSKSDIDHGSFSNGSEQFFGRNGSWQSGSNNHGHRGPWKPDGDDVEQDALYQEAQDEFIYA